jgi:hypothetical protein
MSLARLAVAVVCLAAWCHVAGAALGWSSFFSAEAKQPWRDSFSAADADQDGYLMVDNLEVLLRHHFRTTEQDDPNYDMILANERIFEHQAEEVGSFFLTLGGFRRLLAEQVLPFRPPFPWHLAWTALTGALFPVPRVHMSFIIRHARCNKVQL